jgi:hypothetical protein
VRSERRRVKKYLKLGIDLYLKAVHIQPSVFSASASVSTELGSLTQIASQPFGYWIRLDAIPDQASLSLVSATFRIRVFTGRLMANQRALG